MSKLSEYISDMSNFEANFNKIIEEILIRKQGVILSQVKLRLYNTGLDAKGNLIGYYHPVTIRDKKAKRQRSSFITLRDTGAFYGGMYLYLAGEDLILDSTDEKTRDLISRYGPDILGLSIQDQELIIFGILEPEINKILNKRNQIDLFD